MGSLANGRRTTLLATLVATLIISLNLFLIADQLFG
jgi:Mn2+/Fe2+ NRAMP family transporter